MSARPEDVALLRALADSLVAQHHGHVDRFNGSKVHAAQLLRSLASRLEGEPVTFDTTASGADATIPGLLQVTVTLPVSELPSVTIGEPVRVQFLSRTPTHRHTTSKQA